MLKNRRKKDMKEITLQVNGREMTFSEKELISIVEKHFSGETTQKTTIVEVVPRPMEGRWFEVRPQDIDQKLFENKRGNSRQEETRILILKAFEEMRCNPEKYCKNFTTMTPKMTKTRAFEDKTVAELKEIATNNGGHTADWVELALEWAQRIANGESWKELCNDVDTEHTWYRLVVWYTGYARIGGGAAYYWPDRICVRPRLLYNNRRDGIMSATYFDCHDHDDSKILHGVVPMIVRYEE